MSGQLRDASKPTPVLELALAARVNATRTDDGATASAGSAVAQRSSTTDPAAGVLARCWQESCAPPALVGAVLRVVGATDLADDRDLTAAVASHLPALRAGRIEV